MHGRVMKSNDKRLFKPNSTSLCRVMSTKYSLMSTYHCKIFKDAIADLPGLTKNLKNLPQISRTTLAGERGFRFN